LQQYQNSKHNYIARSGSDGSLIEMQKVSKAYQTPSGSFTALCDINLCIQKNELVAVIGKSGSGKSTLINLIK
jgi:putative ABC transport system ATP-binding protein